MPNKDQSSDDLNVRKRVSIVWKYFEKLSKYRVRCNLCQHEQNYQSTTGNILRHLKSKHNIDATIKGQRENPAGLVVPKIEQKAMPQDVDRVEMNMTDEEEEGSDKEVITQQNRTRERKTKVTSYCEDNEDDHEDPYAEESIQYEEYMVSGDPTSCEPSKEPQNPAKKRKASLEEQRIIAETEYFREKAAYFRMQKNLTALQAKKIKYELDQLLNQ